MTAWATSPTQRELRQSISNNSNNSEQVMTMAKPQKAAETNPSPGAALATREQDAVALSVLDDMDIEVDGLEEASREDLKVAAKVFNMVGVDSNNDPIPKNAFFDTIEETVQKRIDAILLVLHKTHSYSEYNNAEKKTERFCASFDRVTGRVLRDFGGHKEGDLRNCKDCPDYAWRKDADGKNTRNCGDVYNVVGLERESQMPFVVRFKKTSLPVIKTHMQKHHLGRRVVAGKRANVPLFAFAVELSCVMADAGTHALPVIERGAVLSKDEMLVAAEAAKMLREQMFDVLDRTETQEASAEETGGAGDTSFDADGFVDPEGEATQPAA